MPDTALGRDVRGALFMLLSCACIVTSVSMIKILAEDLPEPVIVLFRFLIALLFCAPALWRGGAALLRTRRLGGHLLRSACGFAGFACFVYATGRMPLADVMVLGFTQPLWAAMIAALVFGERLGALRAAALAAGFAGALLVLKPGFAATPLLPALAALGNAVLTAVAMTTVKRLSATEPSDRIATMFLLVGTVLAAPGAALAWAMPPLASLPWLLAIGALAWLSQIGLTRGYALGRFSAMAAMDFARLPLAVAIGILVFAEWPDRFAVLGMALIAAASTTIVLWRARPGS